MKQKHSIEQTIQILRDVNAKNGKPMQKKAAVETVLSVAISLFRESDFSAEGIVEKGASAQRGSVTFLGNHIPSDQKEVRHVLLTGQDSAANHATPVVIDTGLGQSSAMFPCVLND